MDIDFNNSARLSNNYLESSNKSQNLIICILLRKVQLLWEFPFTTRFQNSFSTRSSKKSEILSQFISVQIYGLISTIQSN